MPIGVRRVIRIADYDPQWPLTFAGLKRVIETALGGLALSIEHVGSTSVPGLGAKPIIDLDVVIESRALLPDVVQSLAELGYFHEGDLGVAGREAFGRRGQRRQHAREDSDVPRDGTGRSWPDHHLYVCPRDGDALARHLAFRDYLRQHPDEAEAFKALKRRLARQHTHHIDAYTEGKTAFVEAILERAITGG